jgi:tetratricopeptide (TPR) repeat protein
LRGEEELALEYLAKALALRAFELKYVHRRGTLLQALGRTEEAAKAFDQAKQLELCESRLNEIVRGGDLEYATPDVCLEVADLCEKRGRQLQADGWRYGAEQLRRQAAMQGGGFPAGAGER